MKKLQFIFCLLGLLFFSQNLVTAQTQSMTVFPNLAIRNYD